MSGRRKPQQPTGGNRGGGDTKSAWIGGWATVIAAVVGAIALVAVALVQYYPWKPKSNAIPALKQRYAQGQKIIDEKRAELLDSQVPDRDERQKALNKVALEYDRLTRSNLEAAEEGDDQPVLDGTKHLFRLFDGPEAEKAFGPDGVERLKSDACELPPGIIPDDPTKARVT